MHKANKVEVRFKGSKGDQGRKGAALVITRTGRGREGDRAAVGLLWNCLGCTVTGIQRKKRP